MFVFLELKKMNLLYLNEIKEDIFLTSDSESISELRSNWVAGLAARGRTVDDCDTVERRDIRELMDNVLLRNGRFGSPSSSKSSS